LKAIVIDRDVVDKLVEYVKREMPNEAVALLLGRQNDEVEVEEVVLVSNILKSPTEFHVDPTELYMAYRKAEQKNMDIVAIFHSHPSSPYPSTLDMKFMKLNPVVWLILSTINFELKAFVLKDKLYEVKILIRKKK